jgi:hypothetical protein
MAAATCSGAFLRIAALMLGAEVRVIEGTV